MFNDDSKKVKKGFRLVKNDMTSLNTDILALKANTHEWITYLNAENKQLQKQVTVLQMRLKQLEDSILR